MPVPTPYIYALDPAILLALTEQVRAAEDLTALERIATDLAHRFGAPWVRLNEAQPEGLSSVSGSEVQAPDAAACFSVQVCGRERILGMMVWGPRADGSAYPDDVVALATLMADVLAQAWDHLELRAALQKTHRTLSRRELDVETLFGMAQELNSSLSTKTIAQTLLFSAMGHCAVGAGLVALRDEHGALNVVASRGLTAEHTLSVPLNRAMQGISYPPNAEEIQPWGAFVPIRNRGELRGLLAMQRPFKGRPFHEHEQSFLQALVDQASIALENAALFEDLQTTLERERRMFKERTKMLRYLSDATLSEIQRTDAPSALGGKLVQVTVMFADIRGFTALSERLPPAEVVQILNAYMSEMDTIISRFGGNLDKFIGDGIMAVFTPRDEWDNDSLRAAKAALAMRAALQELNAAEYFQGHQLAIGIGINAGEAIAGNIGSAKRMDYTVIGDNVNLAARMEGLARPGQILLSARVRDRLGSQLPVEFLDTMVVKGKQKAVDVYYLPD